VIERSTRPKTVKVLLRIGADGHSWACSVITSEWNGASRVDTRRVRAHPMPTIDSFPEGIDPDVWRAYVALSEHCSQSLIARGADGW